ncbi:alanine:cation symporter family protein [Kocuria rhizophila]|nr:alanine:cation symporter family protein [Kocuria rhizophila]
MGTGNIAGVAIAITLGEPGAVFWMSGHRRDRRERVRGVPAGPALQDQDGGRLRGRPRRTTWSAGSTSGGWACCSPSSSP